MTTARTIIIGLDGATFDLIDPLVEAGELPTLKRIMTEGVRGILETWPNTNSAAAWSSMITGCNSGKHGIYHFGEAINRPGLAWRPVTAVNRKKDPFWRILSAAGKSVGVINVPITYPADQINGFMLAGMDTPGLHSTGFAHPSDLRKELSQQGIDYIIDVPNLGISSNRDPHHLPSSVERMIEARSRTILHLMQSRPWDVLMAVFVATDRVQHYFWPKDLSAVHNPDWDPIRRVYQMIDGFLAELLPRLDSETTLMLVSDHGFGPGSCTGKGELNRLFARIGLLSYRQGGERLRSRMLRTLLAYGRRFIPGALQDRLARAMPALHLRAVNEHRFSGVDFPGTRVFAEPSASRVIINLEGREEQGTVSQQDYHALREQTRDILMSLTDATTGERIVRNVRRGEEVFRGPYTDRAADLLIEWNYETLHDNLCYTTEGNRIVIASTASSLFNAWNGYHRREGIFIARGPHIKSGVSVTGADIYDVAPTVLYLQKHPVPDDIDGKVLTNIFAEEFLRENPVQYCHTETKEGQQAPGLNEAEAREIEERLRGLGYIE